jgi:cytochrome c oxidase cbb3-type subunit I/II
MEEFSYDDKIVRAFTLATLIWALVAMLVGLIVAIDLVIPHMTSWVNTPTSGVAEALRSLCASLGIGHALAAFASVPQLSFARLRPLHTNAAIFAFAGNAIFAGIYYSTQRLCKARMWSDVLSWIHFWGWQAIIVSAALTLPFAITQSKEYAELEWPIDVAIAIVWLVVFGGNFLMTLVRRRERHLYVALWFYIATIVAVAMLHVFNNLVIPAGILKSYPIYAGVQDAFMQWWYGHNAVAFFLTTPFLGLMYYFVPKAAGRPVYSYRLSIVHFWSLVFIYIWAGPHHLHYTALPEWASTLGMVFSLMLWMPSWGGMINGLLTLRGAWHKVATDPVLKFFVVAITFYGMATFEGPMLSIKSVNSLSHYTDWTIAHVHAGALGWNGFMAFGMIYWLLPKLFQTRLYSQKLANLHFWLATVGILLYIVSIYVAGLTEGLMWRALDESGRLQYEFIETVKAVIPMWYLRVVGGGMYMVGGFLCAWNFYKTWRARPATYDVPVITAPALKSDYVDPPLPANPLEKKPVAEVGKKIAGFGQLWWHRRWERKPVFFTVMTLGAVAVASLFEILPTFLINDNVPTIASVKPYTPLELAGRDVYIGEGCYNCHSQMVRPILSETIRYGEYSKPGESVYDRPFQWGSRRIGPDLAREGGRKNHLWHLKHFVNPQQISPGTVMPGYTWLFKDKVEYSTLAGRVHVMQQLGVPYSDAEVAGAVPAAQAQAKQIVDELRLQAEAGGEDLSSLELQKLENRKVIALVAYLQRLGVDLKKPATPEAAPANPATQPATKETR